MAWPARDASPTGRRARTGLVAVLVAALASVLVAAPSGATAAAPSAPAAPAAASPGDESAFVGRINSLRASKGLSQLQVSGELVRVARNWTNRMVAEGRISHNPSLGSQVNEPWQKLGENVGVGYSVDDLMDAFVASPSHYANLVDPAWSHVGVGVVIAADGRMFTTHLFMQLQSAPAPPPPPPPPPTAAPTTPPATEPATTAPPAPVEPVGDPAAEDGPDPRPAPSAERARAMLDSLRAGER